uniref:Uncharacterized protein n=1 Tax=Chromera velia CCMP2878 TaxID=1169474 RepID=A0A0G4GEH0_9ALVE|mmetsp:Transcript_34601/g.68379  ORF Transcript_34601/g.68379 Transcript_34601/m.68379 type:complete len:304 (+) Transcript_34601:285-1196(+)|eukprot:Cvel_21503.t1-p1 / transcript=Cvel_21503.t1 / gene=Cvel_21503 / organism=Chromera_velia_CCMP2878 / gene_product=Tetratricopeptide repeat protein 4 homolog, putative / transcript_product=Tetratricopeptide repeat protein 4 homolog, putative / location=Cvel_scaffold2023:27601-32387(+) / protein_length=303 / sequence_SO=supercontig / SO=protein_coding / is_pseudo=false
MVPSPAEKGNEGDDETQAASRLKIAQEHKAKGNEEFQKGTKASLEAAVGLYTRALDLLQSDGDINMSASLFANRAAALLKLNKLTEAVDDCRRAISLDPKNIKPYWRGARASASLELWQNAVEFCAAGLAVDGKNEELLKIFKQASEKVQKIKKRRESETGSSGVTGSKEEEEEEVEPIPFHAEEAEDLQVKVNQLHRRLTVMTEEMKFLETECRRCEVVEAEMEAAPSARAFRQTGRVFVLSTREGELSRMRGKRAEKSEEKRKLQERRGGVEHQLKETERRLKGMVKDLQRRQLAQKGSAG